MYLQAERVTKFSKNRLQGSRLQAHRQYLVVEGEEDQVHLLILYGNVAHGSALPLKLGQNVQDQRRNAPHELAIILFRCEAVNAGPHPRLHQLMVPVQDRYVADPRIEGKELISETAGGLAQTRIDSTCNH